MSAAVTIAADVRAGRRRARDVLEASLAAAAAIDPEINAFTARFDTEARRAADAVDALVATGGEAGPLAGVPFAVKNLFDVAGVTTIAGARIHERRPPAAQDATVVARLRAAGAVLVGACNMDAYAYGFTTENTHYGATRNPHDRTRSAGGSSGGSAAVVAAAVVPFSLGSDTNGSIRVPASFTGIFGLKPTFGRVSRAGVFPFVHDLDHVGPFSSSVADLAAIYDTVAGPDRRDPACSRRRCERLSLSIEQGAGGLRVALASGYFEHPLADEARAAIDAAASALAATRRVIVPDAGLARAAAFVLTAGCAGALYTDELRAHAALFEPNSRDRLLAGALVPAQWVERARRFRRRYHDACVRIFDDVDVVIAPATPCTALPLGTETITIEGEALPARASLGLFTQPISFAGLPVVAVPIELGTTLPIGVQLIAAPWREDLVLRAARVLERTGVARARLA